MYRYRWRVSGTICWDRLLLNSFKLPHAYFYGNWRAKILNICRDEGIHLTVTRREAKSLRATKVGSDIPATSASQLRAGLASSALPDANFMPGSPAFPTSEPHRPNCAWNNGAEKRETGLF